MLAVSSDGNGVHFVSRLGVVRTYTDAQWAMIWPKLLNRVLAGL